MAGLTPYLAVADARAAIDWYGEVLGAEPTGMPIVMPDGRIAVLRDPVGHRWMRNQPLP